MARALVTGATGLIGSHVVAELLARGSSVVALLREDSCVETLDFVIKLAGFDLSMVELTRVDSSDYGALQRAFETAAADVVYHCAAQVSLGARSQELVRSNVELTSYVVDACLSMASPPILVHVGSIASLGSSSIESIPSSEDNLFESMSESSPYGRSKFLSQMEVVRGMKLGLRAVIVNPSVVLGFVGSGRGIEKLVEYGFRRGIPLCTEGGNGFVDVRDVARAMVSLSSTEQSWGQSYLLSGMNCSFRELINAINAAGGHAPCRFCVGKRWIKAALSVVTLFDKKSTNSSSVTPQTLTYRSYWDGSKVTKVLSPEFNYLTLAESTGYMYLIYSNITNRQRC